jgi:predicted GIY-YIG superfamily endonuclease
MLYINQTQEVYYVYILKCSNNAYYIGLTNNLLLRFQEHIDGVYPMCYTYDKRPLTMMYYEAIPFHQEAVEREKQLKGWSRKKKEALINRDYHKLQLLAECQNLTHNKYKDVNKSSTALG